VKWLTEERLIAAGYAVLLGVAGVVIATAALSFGPGPRRDAQDCAIKAHHIYVTDTRECLEVR
jgi:hypothetical protein